MHQYWGFGLNIESEIAFPELLLSTFDVADLTIQLGKVPGELSGEGVVKKVRMSASPSEYLLDSLNVAKYYACDGKTITIEPAEGADEESIRLFMLSNAMAAILHQQNKIPLHASGIITDAGLVLFTGPSGIGKSTTVYGLMQEGYKLFTDDVCVLNYNSTGAVEGIASYPMMKLWENTLEKIPVPGIDKTYKVRPNLPKYGLFQHADFINKSYPVKQVYIIKADPLATEFNCSELNKIAAFNALQQNTYRRGQIDMMQLGQTHFKIIGLLANQSAVYEITRPVGSDIDSYINFVKECLSAYGKA